MHDTWTPEPQRFIDSRVGKAVLVILWIAYLGAPMFTGWLAYDWQPNEYYDANRHILLASEYVEDGQGRGGDKPTVWMDKNTHQEWSYNGWAWHRKIEANRMAILWFAYGMIGCFAFAIQRRLRKSEQFFHALGVSVCVNAALAVYTYVTTIR